MSVKIELTDGDFRWTNLPTPIWAGNIELQAGVHLRALYRGARTGRMVAETYSFWVNHRGRLDGSGFREITESRWIDLCDLVGVDPHMTPEDL